MAQQHFFLGDEWLGTRKIPNYVDLGMGSRPSNSYALFCPHCAEVWGKIMHDHPDAYCQPVTSRCMKHMNFPSDGTFTSYYGFHQVDDPRGWTEDLPEAVMRHDVEAATTFFINNPEKIFLLPGRNPNE